MCITSCVLLNIPISYNIPINGINDNYIIYLRKTIPDTHKFKLYTKENDSY